MGEIPIQVPQDRNSDFEPQVTPKYKKSRCMPGGCAWRRSRSKITNMLLPEIEAWQKRPLSRLYIDAMVFNMREDNVILGINEEGRKEVLSITIGEVLAECARRVEKPRRAGHIRDLRGW